MLKWQNNYESSDTWKDVQTISKSMNFRNIKNYHKPSTASPHLELENPTLPRQMN